MRTWAFFLVILCGCGARSGVPLDEGEAAPPFDGTTTASVCLGTPGEAVILGEANSSQPIAVDGSHVYFSQNLSPGESSQPRLMRLPRAGGAPEPIFSGYVSEMVLSGGYVVILRNTMGASFELLRVPRAGGDPEMLAAGQGEPTSLAATPDGSVLLTTRHGQGGPEGLWLWRPGETLKLAASLPQSTQVAASADAAYVVHLGPGGKNALTRVRLSDGSATWLLDDVEYSSSLALDGDDLFSSASFRVDRFSLGPASASRTTLGQGAGALADLAADETHVYFADVGAYHDDLPPPQPPSIPGSIRRVPRQGGEVETLSEEGRGVRNLALDDCHVYWTSERGLVRMRKPP